MFRSFTAKNFRCFRDLTVEPLSRVSLIAGKNNAGKTALLEAVFLHAGANNPRLPLSINIFRGIEQISIDPRDLWGWLFRGKRTGEAIELSGVDQNEMRQRLRISLAEPSITTITPAPGGQVDLGRRDPAADKLTGLITAGLGAPELRMEYDDSTGRTNVATASLVFEGERLGLRLTAPFSELFPQTIFLPTRFRTPAEDAARFSRMVETGREEEVLEIMRVLDPHLRRLMVLVVGGSPMVAGVIGEGSPVPLPLMGEGLVRLLSILLAIADAPGGIVLIDEIENGLHYSSLKKVWADLSEAAKRSDTQLLATTHSWECIRAAYEAFTENREEHEFRLFRLDRANGESRVVRYDLNMLGTALATGLEVR